MTKTLEINGFFSFCNFLAHHPNEIIKNEELQQLLNFCYKAVSNCNCSEKNKEEALILNEEYEKRISNLSKDSLSKLGELFSSGNKYSECYLMFPNSNNTVKIK